jgi:predicted RNA-binding Zn-ribbon protein involved in translation (DUF1610 family)
MLKNGKCPQCGSSDIVSCEQGVGWDVYLQVTHGSVTNPSSHWTTYLCTACGLFENYLTDVNYLASTKSDPKIGWNPIS